MKIAEGYIMAMVIAAAIATAAASLGIPAPLAEAERQATVQIEKTASVDSTGICNSNCPENNLRQRL